MQDNTQNSPHKSEESSRLPPAAGTEDESADDRGDVKTPETLPAEESCLLEDDKFEITSQERDGGDEEKKDDDDNSDLLLDGGWGWFVVLGCFISHIITGGFDRADGVLFLEFTERFQTSAQLTAWPAALCSAIRFLSGPLATAVSNRLSVRASVMAGSLIFGLGVALSGLAPSVPYLFFTYGVLQGVGRGLVYAPAVVIVGMYFNRRRGLGIGLGTAGVGVGTFLLPPLVEVLFQEFGFAGSFLILSAIGLNLCVVAALFRPLSIHRSIVIGENKRNLSTDVEEGKVCVSNKGNVHPESDWNASRIQVTQLNIGDAAPSFEGREKDSRKFQEKPRLCREPSILVCWKSVLNSCFPVDEDRNDSKKQKLIEWSLLKYPPFLFYSFSICLFTAAFKSAFTFLPALASSSGIARLDSAYLLSISGIVDTVGRVLAGFLLELKYVRPFRPLVYNGVIFVIVILSFLSPFMTTFAEFAILFGLYGMMTGTYISQKSVVMVDILGKEKLSSSFGLLICFQGLGTAAGPPLSGLLRDIYGSYREPFFVGGAAMALAGGLMVISNASRLLMERSNRRRKNKK